MNSALHVYGLDDPKITVSLEFDSGKTIRLDFGVDVPVEFALYAKSEVRVDDIYLVDRNPVDQLFELDLFSLRSKQLDLPDLSKLDSIILSNKSKLLILKKDARWRSASDHQLQLDQAEIDAYIESLSRIEITEFIDQPSIQLKETLRLNTLIKKKILLSYFKQRIHKRAIF